MTNKGVIGQVLIILYVITATLIAVHLYDTYRDEHPTLQRHPTVSFQNASAAPSVLFSQYVIGNAERATHLIITGNKIKLSACTSVAISSTQMITAAHCFEDDAHLISIDSVLVPVTSIVKINNDSHDHVIITFKKPLFSHWVVMANQQPSIGEPVFSLGYSNATALLRFHAGYVSAYGTGTKFGGVTAILYQLTNYFGDSGSGIFNQNGQLIATESEVTVMGTGALTHSYTVSFPYMFKNITLEKDYEITTQGSFAILPQSFCTTVPMTFRVVIENYLHYTQATWFIAKGKDAYMTLEDNGTTLILHVTPALYKTIPVTSWIIKDNGKTVILQPCTK